MSEQKYKKVVIIGAGPAGLTAAYQLCKEGVPSVVLEKDDVVGGISRTVNYRGYLFDIGGHRFFTKVKAVDEMWREVLGESKFFASFAPVADLLQQKVFLLSFESDECVVRFGNLEQLYDVRQLRSGANISGKKREKF